MFVKHFSIFVLSFILNNAWAAEDPYGTALGDYNGVTVYSNAGRPDDGLYQCVEFVKRYYREFFGLTLTSVGNANQYYASAAKLGLSRYPNGSVTIPQVGDVLVSNGDSSNVGHVSIVRSVSDSQVCVAQQNFTNNNDDEGRNDVNYCLSMTGDSSAGYNVASFGTKYPITGWLRPTCDAALEKPCKIKSPRSLDMGWYPPMNLCQDATQWFILGRENDKKVYSGYTTSASCPNACYP